MYMFPPMMCEDCKGTSNVAALCTICLNKKVGLAPISQHDAVLALMKCQALGSGHAAFEWLASKGYVIARSA